MSVWSLSICAVFAMWLYISQGSAATHLRCGGQCGMAFVANFLEDTTVKKSGKSADNF